MPVVSCYRVSLLALLVVGMVFSAAPTEDPTEVTKVDCGRLVQLLPADKLNTVFGEWTLIEAYSDNENFVERFQVTNSSKLELQATSSNRNVLLKQQDMIDDICVRYSIHNMTVIENTLQLTTDNRISNVHFLQACTECLVMHISNTVTMAGVPIRMVRSFYVFGKTVKLQESELEPIRKQAQCLQFPLPARFVYDGAAEFCVETESDT